MKDFSNYHGINPNEKIFHDGLMILERSLDGFAAYNVVINNLIDSKVLVYEKWDSNSETKKVIGRIEDIERGNLFKLEGLDWLVTTHPEDNKIYRKAEIRLCNSIFPIESDKTPVLIGYDKYNRPIYEEQVSTKQVPCVVETKYYFNNRNEQITLPEDRIMVTMKYQKAPNIGKNKEFDMYESRFNTTFIDYSKVVNGVGIMTLTGERRMNKNGDV